MLIIPNGTETSSHTGIFDSLEEFDEWVTNDDECYYMLNPAECPPHYPVPAIPIKVGFMPWSWQQEYPSGYWYVASRHMLWTIFQRWGLIIERA